MIMARPSVNEALTDTVLSFSLPAGSNPEPYASNPVGSVGPFTPHSACDNTSLAPRSYSNWKLGASIAGRSAGRFCANWLPAR